jgi:osmoprotectant transport system permease protein
MLDDLISYLSSPENQAKLVELLGTHLVLALLPLLLGLVVAVPLGRLAQRVRWLRAAVLGSATVIYTVPALALFVIMPSVLGTRILDAANVVVALALYTVALLLRPVIDALDAVAGSVVSAATAMGYHPLRRFLAIELPMSIPLLAGGVRVASASNISLASVGALIGTGGLGQLFTEGFQSHYLAPIVVGIVLIGLLALAVDVLLVGLRRLATPWLAS